LEVGQKGSTDKSLIRSSDPGRQWKVLTETRNQKHFFFWQKKIIIIENW
jgi:hypothetical protein